MLTKKNIEKYFMAEKAKSIEFMTIGIAAVVCFIIVKSALCRGEVIS